MSYNDPERLKAVNRFLKLDIDKKAELQEMVELASALCNTMVAMITLMDEQTEYFQFKIGIETKELLREETFCQYILDNNELLIVPDTLKDFRFASNPLVSKKPHVRFYAASPLITHDGYTVGSLSIMGQESKQLTEPQKDLLKVLSKRVVEIMEMEFSLQILKRQYSEAKDSEMKLQSFFKSTGTCHLLIGINMEVIAYNKNVAQFLETKHNVKLYTGINITEILNGQQLQDFIVEYTKALTGIAVLYERRMEYDDEVIWWYIAMEPGFNTDGEIIGISYNATNITERKLHEQEMIKKNERLMEIAHIQSHELRRPVASILGLIELFKFNDYLSTKEEIIMLERAGNDLDNKIRAIIALTK